MTLMLLPSHVAEEKRGQKHVVRRTHLVVKAEGFENNVFLFIHNEEHLFKVECLFDLQALLFTTLIHSEYILHEP